MLETELKILSRVLANCLQFVISDLIGPVKERSIQDNLHLVRKVLEGLEKQHRRCADQFGSVQGHR